MELKCKTIPETEGIDIKIPDSSLFISVCSLKTLTALLTSKSNVTKIILKLSMLVPV